MLVKENQQTLKMELDIVFLDKGLVPPKHVGGNMLLPLECHLLGGTQNLP